MGKYDLNIRAGHNLEFGYSSGYTFEINNRGYIDKTDDESEIYFARRDVKTIQNILEVAYTLSNKAGLRFRARHYWSGANNKNFYTLNQDGSLRNAPWYRNDNNNYNAFNIDMIFRWIFSPGSELSLAWKNSVYDENKVVTAKYWKNFENTWNTPSVNTLSLKILYYIDYNSLRKKK